MTFKKFYKDDIFYNTIVTHPEFEFFVHNQKVYINRESEVNGDFSNKVNHVTQGHISLHEINVNRPSNSLVTPFITKDGTRTAFRTVTTSNFQDSSQFSFGDTITGKYPLSSSIGRIFVPAGQESTSISGYPGPNPAEVAAAANKKYIRALKNPIELSGEINSEFKYENLGTKQVNIISIPSIFYGSSVKRGSLQLDFYVTGTLTAQLKDDKKDGRLMQTYGTNSGSCAGIVLYDYGTCVLTGSWSLHDSHVDNYFDASSTVPPSWLSFGSGIIEPGLDSTKSGQVASANSAYLVKLDGTNKIPTVTMLAHANKMELNYSTNPTFVDYDNQLTASIDSISYNEKPGLIKNITKTKYGNHIEDFQNTTYISKIGIYDEYKNLIAIAHLANPVKKTEVQDYLFKLKLDF